MARTDNILARRDKDGRVLYAIAYNKLKRIRGKRRTWVPGLIDYVHAHNELEARAAFYQSNPGKVDIIGIAPAVGFFVEDEKKVTLSAS